VSVSRRRGDGLYPSRPTHRDAVPSRGRHRGGAEPSRRALAEFEPHALRVRVESVEVLVAALEDVVRLKEAAGRPKDIHVLPILYRFAREKHESGAGDRES
jgi:hypothetical protein